MRGAGLRDRFPMFHFAPGTQAAWDATGGHIDPRAMGRADEALAVKAGAVVVDDGVAPRWHDVHPGLG